MSAPADIPERPKRLTLSEIVALLLQRGPDRSAVTLTRNAKGGTQFDVVARAETVAEAETQAREVYDRLAADYPAPDSHFGGSQVGLVRNAKGDTQIDVTVKVEGGDAESVARAQAEAADVFDRTRARFPMASGSVGAGKPTEKASKGQGDGGET